MQGILRHIKFENLRNFYNLLCIFSTFFPDSFNYCTLLRLKLDKILFYFPKGRFSGFYFYRNVSQVYEIPSIQDDNRSALYESYGRNRRHGSGSRPTAVLNWNKNNWKVFRLYIYTSIMIGDQAHCRTMSQFRSSSRLSVELVFLP